MKISSVTNGDGVLVTVEGDIDGVLARSVPAFLQAVQGPRVEIDCIGIRGINSIGVKIWVEMLEGILPATTFTFSHCPDVFISYVNLLPMFIGRGTIVSVQLPYRCSNCGHEATTTFALAGVDASKLTEFPPFGCPRCGCATDCDTSPDDHLSFLLG